MKCHMTFWYLTSLPILRSSYSLSMLSNYTPVRPVHIAAPAISDTWSLYVFSAMNYLLNRCHFATLPTRLRDILALLSYRIHSIYAVCGTFLFPTFITDDRCVFYSKLHWDNIHQPPNANNQYQRARNMIKDGQFWVNTNSVMPWY